MKFGLKTSAIYLMLSAAFAAASSPELSGSEMKVASNTKVAASWYASWHETDFPLSKVPWKKYTDVFYAFAATSSNPAKLDESDLTGLPKFVSEARKNGVRPLISIGGWTGSRFFSTAVSSAPNRVAFVKAVTDLSVKYKVDGVSFDWEYPNAAGVGCNKYDKADTANFLLFLQELKAHPVGKTLMVTASAGPQPWLGPEGVPVTDVSPFAKVLDFVILMVYDVWGPWSATVGPNAPLDDTCAPANAKLGSAVSAVQAWKKAGMPLDKIVLGVPAYGRSYRVSKQHAFVAGSTTQLALYPQFDMTSHPTGTKWDARPGETDVCGVKSTVPGGVLQYWGMISHKYVDRQGNPSPGQIYKFDTCSKTPFIYDPKKEVMVSYEDAQSMRAKGQFIKQQYLKGFSMWEAGGDYRAFLIDAIRSEF